MLPFWRWAADNGCYAQGERFNAGDWLEWLARMRPHRATCLFAVAPDVFGDWRATWERSAPYLPTIRQLGYPAAYVAQDGTPLDLLDRDDFDVLFIGGSNDWLTSESAYELAERAKQQGRWVHLGRVNTLRRLTGARVSQFDSADGTFVKFGPDRNLPVLYDWLDRLAAHPPIRGLMP